MRKATVLSIAFVSAGFFGATQPAMADGDVNLYTYRPPELIQSALDAFTKTTGIAVNVLFLDKGLIERMKVEGENSQADVILTVDVARLDELKRSGVTQTLADPAIERAIPAKFRDPDGNWFGLTMDPRVVYAAKNRVTQPNITYHALVDPQWKGKVCLRDGLHSSNLGLFADRIAAHGADSAKKWLAGLRSNLARRPGGSDPSQAQWIAEGTCDLALGNASFIAAMLTGTDAGEKAWARAVRVILPDAAQGGTFANISGMALARYAPNHDNAVRLMQFLASPPAQDLYAAQTLEYPIAAGATPSDIIAGFGPLVPDSVSLSDVVRYRDAASMLVDKVGLNDGPGQ